MQRSFDFGASPLPDIRRALGALYGPQRSVARMDPVSQLVKSAISGRTYDEVSWAAFFRLRAQYDGDWEALSLAPGAELEASSRRPPSPRPRRGNCRCCCGCSSIGVVNSNSTSWRRRPWRTHSLG